MPIYIEEFIVTEGKDKFLFEFQASLQEDTENSAIRFFWKIRDSNRVELTASEFFLTEPSESQPLLRNLNSFAFTTLGICLSATISAFIVRKVLDCYFSTKSNHPNLSWMERIQQILECLGNQNQQLLTEVAVALTGCSIYASFP